MLCFSICQKHYRAALDACIDELCDLLANGNIVELGELGFFSTSLKCTQDTDDEKKKIRSESVRFQNVHLRISNTFRKKIRQRMKLERTHSPTKKSKKTETTEETRKERLMLFLQENVCITKNEYISPDRADKACTIDEHEQIHPDKVSLRRRGISRSTVYINNIQH